ncbi:MAG: biopolymer transporter ExbD [Pirellulales bacterium]|nr:biopolymer transporter ExbD [Pirellulales bacterium]
MAATAVAEPPYVDDEDDAVLPPRRPMKADDEMDITPMIDMTFLLLIYFLVASSIDTQASADLPPAHYGKAVSQNSAVIITVGDTGGSRAAIYLGDGKAGTPLAGENEAQETQIRELVEQGMREGKGTVIIKAERGVPHREVTRVASAATTVEGIHLYIGVFEAE